MRILGVDVGFKNVGLILTECNMEKVDVLYLRKVDLGNYTCCPSCTLKHTNDLADIMAHFIVQYADVFSQAEQILIERQPPGGLVAVETLLHFIFRDRAILISPNSMHKYHNIGHLDYEQRKVRTEEIASHYIHNNTYYDTLERKHDIADALCMVLFQSYRNGKQIKNKEKNPFESYTFTSGISRYSP